VAEQFLLRIQKWRTASTTAPADGILRKLEVCLREANEERNLILVFRIIEKVFTVTLVKTAHSAKGTFSK
jgi:hypothetical protein